MEAEFRRDPITGLLVTEFSMGHEAFAVWFNEEYAADKSLQKQLQQWLAEDPFKLGAKWQHIGSEVNLVIEDGQVQVWANALHGEEVALDDDALNIDNSLLEADCGLEDFIEVIAAFHKF
ncbi:YacL family protein [Paraferrimonas sp. SM1919]|uniref:YacL family protein n=1 Tax=Paraferrimonas sp. SM1919 TaxID=2662263 RepID=UPI0013D0345B|nr:YacL family protein [Paraferrimonas sp. SM1919]